MPDLPSERASRGDVYWPYPHFRLIRTLTRSVGVYPRGRVPYVLPDICPDLVDREIFVAGAPGFVLACPSAAEALGAARERVHIEPFFAGG